MHQLKHLRVLYSEKAMQKIYLFWYQSLGTWQFLHTMEVSCSSMIFISTCTIQIILLKCSFCYLIIGELEEISAWHIYNTFTPRLVTERKEGPVLCLRTDAKSSQLTKQSRVRSRPQKLDSRKKGWINTEKSVKATTNCTTAIHDWPSCPTTLWLHRIPRFQI